MTKFYFMSGWLATVLLAASVLVPTAFGQDSVEDVHVTPRLHLPQTEPDQAGHTSGVQTHISSLKVEVNLVLVSASVADQMDRQVTGLSKENFQVFEGKERQEIRHFSSEDAPVSIGAIFDVSGSMADKIERARQAVSEFFKTANPQDEFFMIAFADKPEQVTDFTQSVEDIDDRLLNVAPKGRTALLDAIYLGLNKMRGAKYGKKALLIISDGGDNHSRYNGGQIKSLVKESDVQIYAIGIYDHYFQTAEERLGPELLEDITAVTGGRAFSIDNPNELPDVATKIGVELRNQYVLGYRPSSRANDGKWHKIKVKVVPPKGLSPLEVHAKTGYYARPE